MNALCLLVHLVLIQLTYSFSAPAMGGTPVTLITFDVDGTLIRDFSPNGEISTHSKTFSYAIAKCYGQDIDEFTTKYPGPQVMVEKKKYHGSTDGLIVLNCVKSTLGIDTDISVPKLPEVFRTMYERFASFSDEESIRNSAPLPGVLDRLTLMATDAKLMKHVKCGLVTGNVEGIARKKMRACGITATGLLHTRAAEQTFEGEDGDAFLGGFGSDFCSGDIVDESRQYKDRGEQILIAVRRAQSLLKGDERLVKVVHVGDAPTDLLAAKWLADENKLGDVCVGAVAVCTGKYDHAYLSALTGDSVTGKWEPFVLENGVADESFVACCGIEM